MLSEVLSNLQLVYGDNNNSRKRRQPAIAAGNLKSLPSLNQVSNDGRSQKTKLDNRILDKQIQHPRDRCQPRSKRPKPNSQHNRSVSPGPQVLVLL